MPCDPRAVRSRARPSCASSLPVESGEPTARRVPRAELLTIADDRAASTASWASSAGGACSPSTGTPSPASRPSRWRTRRSWRAGRAWPDGSRKRARTCGRAAAWRTPHPTGSTPGATRGSCSPAAGSTCSRPGPRGPTCAWTGPSASCSTRASPSGQRQDAADAARAAHERDARAAGDHSAAGGRGGPRRGRPRRDLALGRRVRPGRDRARAGGDRHGPRAGRAARSATSAPTPG